MATRRPRATAASLLLLLSASSSSSSSSSSSHSTAAAAFLRPVRGSITTTSPSSPYLAARRHLCSCRPTNTNMAAAPESAGLADIGNQGQSSQAQSRPQSTVASCGGDSKPQWLQQLERALQRNGKDAHSRYVQLASVGEEEDEDGAGRFMRPFVRTVVYRGVFQHEGRACLKMITDARSEKIGHLAQYPHAEVAWYFTKSREQFRVFGTIQVVTHADTDKALQGQRKHQWGCLSDNAKIQFLWPHPKHPLPDRDAQSTAELDALFNPPIPEAAQKTPPDTFCLLLLRPVRIDHLELKASPQRRTLHVFKAGEWGVEPVNP